MTARIFQKHSDHISLKGEKKETRHLEPKRQVPESSHHRQVSDLWKLLSFAGVDEDNRPPESDVDGDNLLALGPCFASTRIPSMTTTSSSTFTGVLNISGISKFSTEARGERGTPPPQPLLLPLLVLTRERCFGESLIKGTGELGQRYRASGETLLEELPLLSEEE